MYMYRTQVRQIATFGDLVTVGNPRPRHSKLDRAIWNPTYRHWEFFAPSFAPNFSAFHILLRLICCAYAY